MKSILAAFCNWSVNCDAHEAPKPRANSQNVDQTEEGDKKEEVGGRLPAWRRMPANGRGVQLVVAVSAAVLLRGQFAHRRRALRGRHMQLR